MGFVLFILVNATLFIRPGEIIPELDEWSIYLVSILACLAVSFPQVLEQFRWDSLRRQPVTLCVLGIWLTVVISNLVQVSFFDAREAGSAFGKTVIYYLLLVSLLDSPGRLRRFLLWLVGFITVAAGIAILQYHGYLDLPSLTTVEERRLDAETGDMIIIPRMCSTGIFNDPNDLCLMLSMGIVFSLYGASDRRHYGALRWAWLAPVGLFGYGVLLTQSRGGLLGLMAGLFVLSRARFGWGKTLLLSAVVGPAVLMLAGGRQTDFDLVDGDDTAQARVQLWSEGMDLFRGSPVFGIGANQFAEEVGLVAHNSFVHAFAELGFFGGTMFACAFVLPLWGLGRLSPRSMRGVDVELRRLQPFLLAMLAAYAVGVFTLSRNYVVPTYLALGLATVYLRQVGPLPVLAPIQFSQRLVWRMAGVGLLSIVMIYLWVRVFASHG
jgi:putative inorganic carbon (HCO3(-)) transporter